jgi:hypothetical protein
MSLKTFTGFRGVAALAEIKYGDRSIQFVIIARDPGDLQAVYETLLPDAPTFDPAMCQKSVMIQASLLPETKIV